MAKERLCYGSDGLDATDIPESEEFLNACMYTHLPITQEGREAEVDREYATSLRSVPYCLVRWAYGNLRRLAYRT